MTASMTPPEWRSPASVPTNGPTAPSPPFRAALANCRGLGINVVHAMTDNGSCYKAKTIAAACKNLNLKPISTKPCTAKTSGKAERFIDTARREWADT